MCRSRRSTMQTMPECWIGVCDGKARSISKRRCRRRVSLLEFNQLLTVVVSGHWKAKYRPSKIPWSIWLVHYDKEWHLETTLYQHLDRPWTLHRNSTKAKTSTSTNLATTPLKPLHHIVIHSIPVNSTSRSRIKCFLGPSVTAVRVIALSHLALSISVSRLDKISDQIPLVSTVEIKLVHTIS